MVPSVKNRADKYVAQRTERPSKVRVDKKIMNPDHQTRNRKRPRIKSNDRCGEKKQNFSHRFEHIFDRMKPDRRCPIHLFRAVVNGMKCPDWPKMKNPVAN